MAVAGPPGSSTAAARDGRRDESRRSDRAHARKIERDRAAESGPGRCRRCAVYGDRRRRLARYARLSAEAVASCNRESCIPCNIARPDGFRPRTAGPDTSGRSECGCFGERGQRARSSERPVVVVVGLSVALVTP